MMKALNPAEFAVLRAIDDSEFGDLLTDSIWTFSIVDNIYGIGDKSQIPGIVSSLNKKGLLVSYQGVVDPNNEIVYMTAAGADAYVSTNNGKCRKAR